MLIYRTYMWQEVRGEPKFRFQTDDPAVAKRMRQRRSFQLVAYGINERLWVYQASFYSPQKARQCLQRITRQAIKKDEATGGFYAETYPKVEK